MKKITTLLLAIVATAMQGMSQNVKVPKFTKFVFVKRGVNIRKAPNTQSNKLVWYKDETKMPWGYYDWADNKENSSKTLIATSYLNFLPVIDESAEWYHVLCVDNWHRNFFHGYVSKKLCKVMKQKAISSSYGISNITTITAGKYKGLSEMDGCFEGPYVCGMIIGNVVNGVAVGKYLTSDSYYNYIDFENQSQKDDFLANIPISYIYGLPGSAEGREGFIDDEGAVVLNIDIDSYDGLTY